LFFSINLCKYKGSWLSPKICNIFAGLNIEKWNLVLVRSLKCSLSAAHIIKFSPILISFYRVFWNRELFFPKFSTTDTLWCSPLFTDTPTRWTLPSDNFFGPISVCYMEVLLYLICKQIWKHECPNLHNRIIEIIVQTRFRNSLVRNFDYDYITIFENSSLWIQMTTHVSESPEQNDTIIQKFSWNENGRQPTFHHNYNIYYYFQELLTLIPKIMVTLWIFILSQENGEEVPLIWKKWI